MTISVEKGVNLEPSRRADGAQKRNQERDLSTNKRQIHGLLAELTELRRQFESGELSKEEWLDQRISPFTILKAIERKHCEEKEALRQKFGRHQQSRFTYGSGV